MMRIARWGLAIALLALPGGATPAASGQPAKTAEATDSAPPSLDGFEIQQYIAAGKYPPDFSIALDNNGQILRACSAGRSAEELRDQGIEFAASQIEFLIAMQLLVRDSAGDLYTTFPILEEETTTLLRKQTAGLAEEISEVIRPDVEALSRELEAENLSRHGYSIMLSYVLDGMVWGFFEEYRQVPVRRLSARRPFWSGEVWAVRPARDSVIGTRSIGKSGLTLKLSFGSGSDDEVDSLFAEPDALRQVLEAYAKNGRVENVRVGQRLVELGLIDAAGLWTIPVIDEIEKGPLFRAAETVTSNLVDVILEKLDLPALQKQYGFRNGPQALVVTYHELMWDLMERFEESGLIEKPEVLSSRKGDGSGLAAFAFLVDRRREAPNRQDVLEPKHDSPEEAEAGAERP